MTRLFMANLYRMRKYRLTKHLLLPACFFAAVCAAALDADAFLDMPGSRAAENIMSYVVVLLDFLLLPVLVHFIVSGFHNRTAELERMGGHSIHRMLMSRVASAALAVTATVVVMAAAVIIGLTAKNGWIDPYNTEYSGVCPADVIRWIFFSLFALLQFAAVTVLAACVFKDSGLALLLALGVNLSGMIAEMILGDMLSWWNIFGVSLELAMVYFPGMQMYAAGNEFGIVLGTVAGDMFLAEHGISIFAAGVLEVVLLYMLAYYAVKRRLR